MEERTCDVLILGSGAAGLRAAISAREKGLDVCVVSKASPGKGTCTGFSAGVFASSSPDPDSDSHRDKTLQAGRGINQVELVKCLVQEIPLRIRELMAWGFKGNLHEGYLYANGRPPVWGEAITRCLISKNMELGTRFIGGLVARDICVRQGSTAILAFAPESGKWISIISKACVLATGGAAALFLRHDNPKRITGDGYALGFRAGALLQDMEFVQFYPLGLAEPGLPPFLVPARLADEGVLLNQHGENILDKYDIHEHPVAERARDRLSRVLFSEIYKHDGHVTLDLTGLASDQWPQDPFSLSAFHILGKRYGAFSRPVRIAPMAHHVMGGVWIDAQGATSVPGLFAAGEVTGGLHGANRMAGNALSETLVFGNRAGNAASDWALQNTDTMNWNTLSKELKPVISGNPSTKKKTEAATLLAQLRKILWERGGVIRSGEGIRMALEKISVIMDRAKTLPPGDDHQEMLRIWEVQTGSQIAQLMMEGALRREESRGAHFREDSPEQDDAAWRGNLQVQLEKDGSHVWNFKPILEG